MVYMRLHGSCWFLLLLSFYFVTANSDQVCKRPNKQKIEQSKIRLKQLSNLFDVNYIKQHTPNYGELKVTLKTVSQKSVGVFANRFIEKSEIVAYYKVLVDFIENYFSSFDDLYNMLIYDKNERPLVQYTGDIYEESNQAPIDGVPFWGYLIKEPGKNETENVIIQLNTKQNYYDRDEIRTGDTVIFYFIAKRDIEIGEELMWCYGQGYQRHYETSCAH